jgi:hypothetical protein
VILLTNAEAGRIPLGDGVVHSHCTSPPYWRLRNYSGKKEEEEDPQRIYWPEVIYRPGPGLPEITVPAGMYALGMEPTPELFIAHVVLIYRQVYRVTREDSCGWCVIGDCFWDSNKRRATRQVRPLKRGEEDGQLIGIPGMLWRALQGDGWYVRNDVCWFKKSPMPESVQGVRWERHRIKIAPGRPAANQAHLPEDGKRPGGNRGNQWGDVQNQPNAEWQPCPGCPACDPHAGYVLRRGSWRHTRSHETILMLAKSMGYFCDQEAVREAGNSNGGGFSRDYAEAQPNHGAMQLERGDYSSGRNPRSVLSPSPQPYAGSHYATYPPDLIRPLIRASPECGAGWAAVVMDGEMRQHHGINKVADNARGRHDSNSVFYTGQSQSKEVIAYRPTCGCNRDDWTPGLVLDPFVGSGTTLEVAREEGLNAIGLDLSYDYLHDQARARLGFVALAEWENGKDGAGEPIEDLPLFAQVSP